VELSARLACETWRKRAAVALACGVLLMVPAIVRAQAAPAHEPSAPAGQPAHDDRAGSPAPAAAEAHGATAEAGHSQGEGHGEAHESSPWPLIGKIVNFAILAGAVFYLARKPFSQYLADRGTQVRDDLVRATEMKEEAARQISDIDAKLKQLPAELDALRARGRDEVAAEEKRIDEAAAAERTKLLEQTRREIDLQLRAARRNLVTHAADLAVQVARDRIRAQITTDDQARLVDQYLAQVKKHD
jgi:F-type H+-transporting ATPase subunit b